MSHFLDRLVRGGNDTASTEFELGMGGLLGLLAAPGAFTCFLLLDKYSTFLNWLRRRLQQDLYITSVPDKYLFLCLAMAITGIVTVLKWDRILPDSQDYLNLAPLPIRPRSVLMANAAAIGIAVLIFAVDVNGCAVFGFPLIVSAAAQANFADTAHFVAVHAACTLLASLFTFCAVFAFFGSLAALLPRAFFQAISSWLRGGGLAAFLMLLLSGCAGPRFVIGLLGGDTVRFLPSFWYLGLYQSWQHRGTPLLRELGRLALPGLGIAFLLMVITYLVGYRRRYAAVLETAKRPRAQRLSSGLLATLDLFSARPAGFSRACYRFAIRALLRNEAHRLCIAVSIGLGWLLSLQYVSEGRLEEAPLVAAYLLILGLRIALDIPAGISSNWVFRAVLDPRENESRGVARQVMLGFLAPAVLVPALALAWWSGGFLMALLRTGYVLALSLVLMEVLLFGYRKVPLACPVPGFRENLVLLCLAQVIGFELFTHAGAAIEHWLAREPVRFALVPAVLAVGWFLYRKHRNETRAADEFERGLLFENLRTPTVERLNLFE